MKQDRLDQVMQEAVAAGVLPESASRPVQESRPWPVVLLTALGAWLAAIPLLAVVGMLLGDLINKGPGPYFVGALMIAGVVVVLRAKAVPLFIEQLAVPGLLVGTGTLAYGLYRDMSFQAASAALALVAFALAAAIARTWLRVLLGAAAACLVVAIFMPLDWNFFRRNDLAGFWLAWHAGFALWLVVHWMLRNILTDGSNARLAAALESVATGWVLAILVGLAVWSGMTFLIGGALGGGLVSDIAREIGPRMSQGWGGAGLQVASVALSIAAAGWLAHCWHGVRQPWCAGVALVLIGLSWFMPSLGAVLVVLAFCASSGRVRVAAAAAIAATWIIGAFYYQIAWPLASKALLLIGAAAALGALAWLASRQANGLQEKVAGDGNARPAASAAALGRTRLAITICGLAVLAVANIGIWQKEDIIAHGKPVFVEMAPVDPRSLMQGDYMQLRFRILSDVPASPTAVSAKRPHLVVNRDERGVATFVRLHNGEHLAADEFLIELTPKNGDWILVSDGWFFKEGEADRWSKARYGEFRVNPDGRALLVGLRGQSLETL